MPAPPGVAFALAGAGFNGDARFDAILDDREVQIGDRSVRLTNVRKRFWPRLRLTKGDLLRYYADMSAVLVPYLAGRAMVLKRCPDGIASPCFFMKRVPNPHPPWLTTCSITHARGNRIAFPVVDDSAALLWVVNLGCIDLNPWYARCDDVNRPDYLHFDLDPTPGATFRLVREAARVVHDALADQGIPSYPKTTGSRGVHLYVPIVRGPLQKTVWAFAKAFARKLAERIPRLLTAEYRVALRPPRRVLIDYNQNAWGRTLASVYSVRPVPLATVSTPVTWDELDAGAEIGDFRLTNVPARVQAVGDLWAPIRSPDGRFDLERVL
jgi:bifunctional non-homologous end joining protein LigD